MDVMESLRDRMGRLPAVTRAMWDRACGLAVDYGVPAYVVCQDPGLTLRPSVIATLCVLEGEVELSKTCHPMFMSTSMSPLCGVARRGVGESCCVCMPGEVDRWCRVCARGDES